MTATMDRSACVNQETCPLAETKMGCRTDVHHLYYDRKWYTSTVEKEFRELPENKIKMCRADHEELHATEWPPEKPSPAEMRDTIELSRFAIRSLNLIGEAV